jgi:hypothetical protein
MFTIIPYVLVPLLIWGFLIHKTKKETSKFLKKLVNIIGSTLVIIGTSLFLLDLIFIPFGFKIYIILFISVIWIIYYLFFWNRKKKIGKNENI